MSGQGEQAEIADSKRGQHERAACEGSMGGQPEHTVR